MTGPDAQAVIANRALDIAYKVALATTRDAFLAEDIAQEVALAALTQASQLRNPDALNKWLYRTATYKSIDAIRRRDRQRKTDQLYAGDRSRELAHELDPGIEAVVEMIAVLPPQQRAAMVLRYVFDLPDRAIADALGCRPSTARSWLTRGAATLRANARQAPPEDPSR